MKTIFQSFFNKSSQAFLRLAAVVILLGSTFGSAFAAQPTPPAPKPLTPATAPFNIFLPAVRSNGSGAPVTGIIKALAASVTLPASTCTLTAGVYGCDVYAMTGTLTLPLGSTPPSVPIWGFSASAVGPAGVPGPTLVVPQGSAVNITLHNVNVATAVSLSISQAAMIPDTTGVAAGASKTYSFGATVLQPGTYLYEAGLTADGPREVAMGLYGALVVRSSACVSCAYTASSAYVDEALVVLSEIDPAFNAAPLTFGMNEWAAKFWLINGKPYPDDDNPSPVANTSAGSRLLVRYVNAGLLPHSMALLGLRQMIVAADAKPETNQASVVAQTIPPGGSLDTIVTVPPGAASGSRYPLFDAAMRQDNGGLLSTPAASNPAYTPVAEGGMLTLLTLAGNLTANGGPIPSNVAVVANPSNGLANVTLTATLTALSGTVSAAEFFTDLIHPNGGGTVMTGTFGGVTANVSATIPVATLASLSSGNHTLYVNGQDSNGLWGPVGAVVLNLDKTGPSVTNTGLTPSITNGTVDVSVQATATDVATGNQNVTAAEYFIDPAGTPPGGTGTAITLSTPAAIESLSTTILAATVLALPEGNHVVALRAQDALGNWGAFGNITLTVDKSGPISSALVATPNPTNGKTGVQLTSNSGLFEKITATFTDPLSGGVNSVVQGGEYFVDTLGPNGSGGVFLSNSGVWTTTTTPVYAFIPLYAIMALSQGPHNIYVHGQDAAGNWGPVATLTLVVDKTGPATVINSLAPNPTAGAASVTLNATATDPVNGASPASNITGAEWFFGPDTGPGFGHAVTMPPAANPLTYSANVPLAGMSFNSYLLSARAQDAAANWGPAASRLLSVMPATGIFADGFELGNTSAWSLVTGPTALTVGSSAVMGATPATNGYGLQAVVTAGASGFVTDSSPANVTNYHARFYFNPNSTLSAAQDIFVALNSANVVVLRVQYQATGVSSQVRVVVTQNGGVTTITSAWFNINQSTPNSIEVAWSAGLNQTIMLTINGAANTMTGQNTTGLSIKTVRLGPQNVPAGVNGTEFFDSFVSTTTAAIGQ